MDNKHISTKELESLTEAEQLRLFNDLVKDIPREDLKMLIDTLPEISKIQRAIDNAENI